MKERNMKQKNHIHVWKIIQLLQKNVKAQKLWSFTSLFKDKYLIKAANSNDPLHVWGIWSRWQIVCGSYNELMVVWRSIKMEQATMCDVGERFWEVLSPQMLLTKFGANKSNGRGGVGKRTFIIFFSVSCHWDRPMWRYTTLRVLSKVYRKLLFNNLSILWNIKILLITFCQESPQMLCAKFCGKRWNRLGGVRKSRFATFLRKKMVGRHGCGLYHKGFWMCH